ncbi:MAG: ABC transporter permease [bacterium]|nr:ABC transporter permease [bacterium]
MKLSAGETRDRGPLLPKRVRASLAPATSGIFYALVTLILTLVILAEARDLPFYLSARNVSNVMDQVAMIGMLSVFTTVVLISGNFDISIAAIGGLGAVTTLLVIDEAGVFGAVVIAVGLCALVGVLNGVLVQVLGINAFIVTLGTLTAGRGLILVMTDGRTTTADDPQRYRSLERIVDGRVDVDTLLVIMGVVTIVASATVLLAVRRQGRHHSGAVALAVVAALGIALGLVEITDIHFTYSTCYMLAMVLLVWLVLRFTTVGRRLDAVGGNPEAARLSGIRVSRYRVVAFILNGAAAGFVGVIFAARLGAVDTSALEGAELTAIAAAILGGTSLFGGYGSVPKSIAGALILVGLRNGFNMLNLGANYQRLVEGIVILVAAAIYVIADRKGAPQHGGGH